MCHIQHSSFFQLLQCVREMRNRMNSHISSHISLVKSRFGGPGSVGFTSQPTSLTPAGFFAVHPGMGSAFTLEAGPTSAAMCVPRCGRDSLMRAAAVNLTGDHMCYLWSLIGAAAGKRCLRSRFRLSERPAEPSLLWSLCAGGNAGPWGLAYTLPSPDAQCSGRHSSSHRSSTPC